MPQAEAPATLSEADRTLLARRLLALNDGDLVLRDWDMTFVQSVCFRKPEALSPRQRQMVELLCWRYRAQIAPDLAPASEPKMPARDAAPPTRRRSPK
jgi:hypothetical protein